MLSVLLSASVERLSVSRMRDFFFLNNHGYVDSRGRFIENISCLDIVQMALTLWIGEQRYIKTLLQQFSRNADIGAFSEKLRNHVGKTQLSLYQTLSIWLEIKFTSIFFKHQFALINHKIFMRKKQIYSFITKSFMIFFPEDIYLIVWLLECFAPPKTWILDLH